VAFPYKQSPEDTQRTLDAFAAHETIDRLHQISAPTLVLAGGLDPTARPELGRAVADAIPGALFEVQEGESHQPFQEVPDRWNARVAAFWQDVEARPVPHRGGGKHPTANG
jgi:pimeloyl-ACP methyl ester carboxylesterase